MSLLVKLPEEIHDEIFLKLPGMSILASRCVCKLFYDLLSKPSFIKNHVNRTIQSKINPKLLCFQYPKEDNPPIICSIPIDYAPISSSTSSLSPLLCEFNESVLLSSKSNNNHAHSFLGSCNGLVCLKIDRFYTCDIEKEDHVHYSILNPLTGEYKDFRTSPQLKHKHYDPFTENYGFGYDSNLDSYKLVMISDFEKSGCFNIDVYTLKSDSWRRIQVTVNYSFRCDDGESSRFLIGYKGSYGVLFNGSIHWLGFLASFPTQGKSAEVIVCFDISSETMVHMPLPENIVPPIDFQGEMYMNVGVWGHCICIACVWGSVRIDVWVMQEYGVKESWMKKYTTTRIPAVLPGFLIPYWQTLWCFHGEEILVNSCGEDLYLYDPTNERVRSVVVPDVTRTSSQEIHAETIVSLNSGTYLEKQITHHLSYNEYWVIK
ncbi:F-box/kelch-repeat protein At3g06240-like [Papaver somniferum]|uniref:F-box/kelch-repeat protein At3g06240-like n=1 Tax=Papaver somniferum TaxID=3469 RepID=UPI000E6FB439|nr:F-box/kelch-repeat protein At3g06240-like [Papaver somniferum]